MNKLRSKLKLFLQYKTCKKVATLQNIIPEKLAVNNASILVLAPHPDDEVIGCFGLLNNCKRGDVVVITDGRKGFINTTHHDEVSRIRSEELRVAMSYFNNCSFKQLDYEDNCLFGDFSFLDDNNFDKYDVIAVPNIFDFHMDHRAVALALADKIKKGYVNDKCKILLYEVWGTNPFFNRYIDISDTIDKKIKVIREYKSQIQVINYDKRIKCLNYYRGMCVSTEYAECYLELTKKQYLELIESII